MNVTEFLLWEKRSRDTIDVKRCYVDIAGDLVTGVLLSQIVYWHLPTDNGESRLRVYQDGSYWLAKKRDDWWQECRISPKQFDRAIEILESKHLVVTKLFKFAGSPVKHICLNWSNLFATLEALQDMVFPQRSKSNLPKGQNGNSPKVKMDFPQRSISSTETTAETTTETTTLPPNPPRGEERSFGFEVESNSNPEFQESSLTFVDKSFNLNCEKFNFPEGQSSARSQHSLCRIDAIENYIQQHGELPPWRVTKETSLQGFNLEFVEWLRSKWEAAYKQPRSTGDVLSFILAREPGGKLHQDNYAQLLAEIDEWAKTLQSQFQPSEGQLLASEVAIALNSPVNVGGVDRFKKTAGKYDWEIAPGEPVPSIVEWYAKKIQYSKRPEAAGKPPMVLARQDFCDRFLAAGIYEEYQSWAKAILANHDMKVASSPAPALPPTIEAQSREVVSLAHRVKSYISQAHVAVLRPSLQQTIAAAMQDEHATVEDKLETFQLVLDNPHLRDWALENCPKGFQIVEGKICKS